MHLRSQRILSPRTTTPCTHLKCIPRNDLRRDSFQRRTVDDIIIFMIWIFPLNETQICTLHPNTCLCHHSAVWWWWWWNLFVRCGTDIQLFSSRHNSVRYAYCCCYFSLNNQLRTHENNRSQCVLVRANWSRLIRRNNARNDLVRHSQAELRGSPPESSLTCWSYRQLHLSVAQSTINNGVCVFCIVCPLEWPSSRFYAEWTDSSEVSWVLSPIMDMGDWPK